MFAALVAALVALVATWADQPAPVQTPGPAPVAAVAPAPHSAPHRAPVATVAPTPHPGPAPVSVPEPGHQNADEVIGSYRCADAHQVVVALAADGSYVCALPAA
jgi:hypothetical protein